LLRSSDVPCSKKFCDDSIFAALLIDARRAAEVALAQARLVVPGSWPGRATALPPLKNALAECRRWMAIFPSIGKNARVIFGWKIPAFDIESVDSTGLAAAFGFQTTSALIAARAVVAK